MIESMRMILFLLVLLGSARADEFVDVKLLEIGYRHNFYPGRSSLTYPDKPIKALDLKMNLSILDYAYWDNWVNSEITEDQYKSISYNTRIGLNITKQLQIGIWHQSQHVFDKKHTFMDRFPVEDGLELRITIIGGKGRKSLW